MSARGGSPTIVDVAREAGVSIKTVSRVLNHEPGVHESTRDQVLKVVEALRYRPKQSARSLAGGRSFLIGLLYYDPSAAFVGSVQQGATVRCRELGYHLVVESLHNDAPDLRHYAGVAEASLYVERASRRKGAGRVAMLALIDEAAKAGFWKLVSRVFVENRASRGLIATIGFREVGVYEKHGKLDGVWKDVMIVELLIPGNL